VYLSLYVVFTSRQVARQALPQHRRALNALLREPGPWVYTVSFTDLDHLRTLDGEGTAAELLQKGMQQTWEVWSEDGKWKGDLHKAYEQEWEKMERRRRERERRAYWASRRD
jgi:nicotinamidase-related amidase